ncbi:hypothetical protein SGM_3691 [Streptomyces griseoaurantiacus M045]|uniref:Uncharacterized protein n=1 Tax=Streptomyces griseoaurantiacus M045 TaxID=996637 RepID=F3NKM7_9ACTN|nr:hypothetical protein SGM_3691 [Streptomyces griseoaurantiacus M045]
MVGTGDRHANGEPSGVVRQHAPQLRESHNRPPRCGPATVRESTRHTRRVFSWRRANGIKRSTTIRTKALGVQTHGSEPCGGDGTRPEAPARGCEGQPSPTRPWTHCHSSSAVTHPVPGSGTGAAATGPRSTICARCSCAEAEGSAVSGGGSEAGGGVGSGSGGVKGALGAPVGPAGSPPPPAWPPPLCPPVSPGSPPPPLPEVAVDGSARGVFETVGAAFPCFDSPGRGDRPFRSRRPPAAPSAPTPATSSPRTTVPCGPVERPGPGRPASWPTLTHPVAAATVRTAAASRNGTSLGRTGSHLRGRAKRVPLPNSTAPREDTPHRGRTGRRRHTVRPSGRARQWSVCCR